MLSYKATTTYILLFHFHADYSNIRSYLTYAVRNDEMNQELISPVSILSEELITVSNNSHNTGPFFKSSSFPTSQETLFKINQSDH
jgi:hypothetical protein